MREIGFYIANLDIQWEVAHWDGESWTFVGEEKKYKDSMVECLPEKIWLPEPKDTRDFSL